MIMINVIAQRNGMRSRDAEHLSPHAKTRNASPIASARFASLSVSVCGCIGVPVRGQN